MTPNGNCTALADPNRFRPIQNLHMWSPDCMVAVDDCFKLMHEFLLITDSIFLGDIINATNHPAGSYVQTHGVRVTNHGGQASCPLLWCNPYLLLPLSLPAKKKMSLPSGTVTLAERISCRSRSLLFLPLGDDIPHALRDQVIKVCAEQNGVKIKLAPGTYRVFYEQLEPPEGSSEELYRNIVAQKQ